MQDFPPEVRWRKTPTTLFKVGSWELGRNFGISGNTTFGSIPPDLVLVFGGMATPETNTLKKLTSYEAFKATFDQQTHKSEVWCGHN